MHSGSLKMFQFKNYLPVLFVLIFYSSSQAQTEKFKFGISAPLSGALAEYGTAVKNGILLAKEDKPDSFDKIELVIEDSQWDAKTAVLTFNWLKNIKKVNIVYNWGNPTSEAIAPLAERSKFPLLTMSSDGSITKDGGYIIRTVNSGEELGALLGGYVKSKNFKSVGAVLAENSYVQTLYNGLEKSLKGSSTKLELFEKYKNDERDFKISIAKLKQKKFDGLAVFLISGQVRTFFKQMQGLDFKIPTFGEDSFGSKSEIEASGPLIEGAVFPDLAVKDQFHKRYLERFGDDVQVAFAANAYDVATLVAENFSDTEAPKLTSEQILERLKKAKPISGAHGAFKYENTPDYGPAFSSGMVLRKIENGGIVNLQ